MEQRLLTLAAAAAYIDRSEATLRWWITRGEGPRSFRQGRRRMYRVEDIDRWIDEQAQAEPAGAA